MSHMIARCSAGVFYTGSRGDVFVVRKSKPVENLRKNGLFWSRYSFVTHSIDTDRKPRDWGVAGSAYSIKSFTRHLVRRAFGHPRATCRAPARIWLAVIDSGSHETSLDPVFLRTRGFNPGGGYSHTLPIRVCAAQRGRDFEAPDLERGIHFRGVF